MQILANQPGAESGYAVIGVLILVAFGMAGAILLLTHMIGPSRHGPVKDSTYESGVVPTGDARRRFNVRFYVVAMLFLLFDVEIVFFYPWAKLFSNLTQPSGPAQKSWSDAMVASNYGAGFMLAEMLVFVAILLVGYVYAWRKGAFRWS